jgi:hypothetical protein
MLIRRILRHLRTFEQIRLLTVGDGVQTASHNASQECCTRWPACLGRVLRHLQGGTQAELAGPSPNLTSKSVGAHPGGRCGVAAGSSGSVEVRKDRNEAAEEFERDDPSDRS